MRRPLISSAERPMEPADRHLAALAAGVVFVFLVWLSLSFGVMLASVLHAGRWAFPTGLTWWKQFVTAAPIHTWFAASGPRPGSVSQVLICAAVLLIILGAGAVWLWLWARSFRVPPGMAPASEARAHLSAAALLHHGKRSRAAELRPDLYQPTVATPTTGEPVVGGSVAAPRRPRRVPPQACAYHLGRSMIPRGVELWAALDQAAAVIGPPGSGKTLGVLLRAFADAPGGRLFATTKLADIYLAAATVPMDSTRQPLLFDPLGQSSGIAPLIWDPVAGCVDSHLATRRGRAFAAGTLARGGSDDAAQFYAGQSAIVIAAFLHAAALTGRTIRDVVGWVAAGSPAGTQTIAEEILSSHPSAEPTWAGLLAGATRGGDERTVGNTWTTVRQALSVFQHSDVVERCTPTDRTPATDLDAAITDGTPLLVLGKNDEYSSVTPLLTAVIEDLLDRVEDAGNRSPYRRLAPPFLAVIDELPNTAPIPTLHARIADGRGRGLCVLYGIQGYSQLIVKYGADQARAMMATTNVWVVFGGSKEPEYNRDLAALFGQVEVVRSSTSRDLGLSSSGRNSVQSGREDRATIEPHDVMLLPEWHAFILASRRRPMITKARSVLTGAAGDRLIARAQLIQSAPNLDERGPERIAARTSTALEQARQLGLVAPKEHS